MILSGESALSQYTFINPPRLKTYAIDKLNNKNISLQKEYYSQEEQVGLQIWNYDPLLFSQDKKSIDIISLIISLLDNMDERLEIEIDQLVKNLLNKKDDGIIKICLS